MERIPAVEHSTPPKSPRAASVRCRGVAVVGVVALVAVLAACGSGGGYSFTTTTTSPPVVLSSAQLGDALLAVGDLPSGWSVHDSTTATSDLTFGMGGADAGATCPSGAAAVRTETHGKSEVIFNQSASESELTQTLGSAPDAESHYADLKAAYASCLGQTWNEGGGGASMTMSLAEVPGPKAGDESVSYRLTLGFTGLPNTFSGDVTLARRATVVEQYTYFPNPFVATGQLSADDFAVIVNTGDQKVAAELDKAAASSG